MKKELKKTVSIALCLTTLSLSSIYITPAFAAETSSSVETETDHKFIPSILLENKVSKIPEDHAYIPAKTKISLENTKTIDSKTAHTGDPVQFKTMSNILINDVVVIPAGAIAKGTITKAVSAGGLGRAGKIEFSINSIQTLNCVDIPLAYDSSKAGQSDGGAVAVFAVVSILGGLFMKGTNVQCVEGTKIEATVTEDTDLNVTFDNLAKSMDPNKSHGVNIVLKQ